MQPAAHLTNEVEVGRGSGAPRRWLRPAARRAGGYLGRRQHPQAGLLPEADAAVLGDVPTDTR